MGPWGVGLQGECMNEKAKTAAAQRSNDTSHVARVRDGKHASARYVIRNLARVGLVEVVVLLPPYGRERALTFLRASQNASTFKSAAPRGSSCAWQ